MSTSPLSPLDHLKQEHRTIERVLDAMTRLSEGHAKSDAFDRDVAARALEFIRDFADGCHHAKEENLLFPTLEACGIPKQGGPIGMMLYEHDMFRALTQRMATALENTSDPEGSARTFCEAAEQYAGTLRNHIMKEDNILYRMGEQVMSDEDIATLARRFVDVDGQTFGSKTRDQLLALAESLASR